MDHETAGHDFGRVLKARREALGLTRRGLVDASGLSYPYVSQLETGSRLPSHRSLARLARALQLEPADLAAAITFDEESMPRPQPDRMQPLLAHEMPPPGVGSSGWQSNPAFLRSLVVGSSASRQRPDPDVIVAQLVDLISSLPPGDRLDALGRAQRQVVDELVEERVRQATAGGRS
jgi:transcriptional regulator with XRE-family HTH domain